MDRKADARLLLEYAQTGGEGAFHEIVVRHADLVYSAALRQIESPDLARDITQNVFADLARKAAPLSKTLTPESSLVGWLYRATTFESQNLRRTELRRASRERQAMQEFVHHPETTLSEWELLRPCLDEAMAGLGESDREAVLLRFFKNQPLREVGLALGVSDDAAQKRISRALEKLREILSRQRRPIAAGALAVAISAHAVQAAPAGLAGAISTIALLAPAGSCASAITSTKAIAMTTLHKTLIGATLAVVVGAGIYQVQQNSRLREQVQILQATEKELSADLEKTKTDKARLAERLTQADRAASLPKNPPNELLKLRGAANLNSREIAQLRAALTNQSEKLPESVASIMSSYLGSLRTGEKEFQENDALSTLAKMSARLSLTPSQQQQVRDILTSKVDARTELEVSAETGGLPFEEVRLRRNKVAQEEEEAIKALLSPDQLAVYQEMQKEDDKPGIKNWASREASRLAASLNLAPEQRDQAAAILNDLKPGQGGPRLALYSNAADQLASRMQALQSLLNERQAQAYLRMLQQDIEEHDLMARITKAMNRTE